MKTWHKLQNDQISHLPYNYTTAYFITHLHAGWAHGGIYARAVAVPSWEKINKITCIDTNHNQQTQSVLHLRFFKKDIGLLIEGDYGNNDCLRFDVLQVGLRKKSHSLTATIFGEDERIPAQTHGAGLEAVSIQADGLLAGFTWAFFCEPKAGMKRDDNTDDTQYLIIQLLTSDELVRYWFLI